MVPVVKANAAPRLGFELALLLILATLWGASYSFIKLGVATIPPLTLIAGRTGIAAAILVCVMRLQGVAMPRGGALWGRFLVQALANSVLPFTLIAWAEHSVDAGLAAILNAMTPVLVFLMSWVSGREESVTRRKLLGVVSGLIGVCLIIGTHAFGGLDRQLLPELAILAATACYAVAAIYGRGFRGMSPLLPATGSLLCGTAIMIPLSLIVDRPWTLSPSSSSLMALMALALFSTAFAFILYFRLIGTIGSVATMAQAYIRVPIGVAIGMTMLGEIPSSTVLIGLVFVVVSVAAMTLPSRTKALSDPRGRWLFAAAPLNASWWENR